MISAFAYYPMWKKAAADRRLPYRTDTIQGVRVHRCWHFVPRTPSGLHRIVHEASFVVTSTLRALLLERADVMVVVSPPLLLGAAAWLVGCVKGAPHVLHIQDLQPDAAEGLGMLDRKWLLGLLRKLERFNYRAAARVSVICEGMMRTLKDRGVSRLVYFPNWIPARRPEPERGLFREKLGIKPDELMMLYSGNIGMKQGLDLIVEAAAKVPEVRLVICGDGAARPELEVLVAALGARNVTLLPLQSATDYACMMADADVCVIGQRAGCGVAFFPSKLLSSVALGKPVLAVADRESELAQVVIEDDLGFWVAPGDVNIVAEAIRGLGANRPRLEQCARNGARFAARFKEEYVLREFECILRELAEPEPSRRVTVTT